MKSQRSVLFSASPRSVLFAPPQALRGLLSSAPRAALALDLCSCPALLSLSLHCSEGPLRDSWVPVFVASTDKPCEVPVDRRLFLGVAPQGCSDESEAAANHGSARLAGPVHDMCLLQQGQRAAQVAMLCDSTIQSNQLGGKIVVS